MKQWIVKKGNTSVQDIPIYDKNGDLVTNLASVTAIKFQVKEGKEDTTPKISKTLGSGIEVNTPSSGYVRITLIPTDTAIDVGDYYMALQITWSSTDEYETVLEIEGKETEGFRIKQDTIQ